MPDHDEHMAWQIQDFGGPAYTSSSRYIQDRQANRQTTKAVDNADQIGIVRVIVGLRVT